jgi:hypothetical protein
MQDIAFPPKPRSNELTVNIFVDFFPTDARNLA